MTEITSKTPVDIIVNSIMNREASYTCGNERLTTAIGRKNATEVLKNHPNSFHVSDLPGTAPQFLSACAEGCTTLIGKKDDVYLYTGKSDIYRAVSKLTALGVKVEPDWVPRVNSPKKPHSPPPSQMHGSEFYH